MFDSGGLCSCTGLSNLLDVKLKVKFYGLMLQFILYFYESFELFVG